MNKTFKTIKTLPTKSFSSFCGFVLNHVFVFVSVFILVFALSACSTKKNTAMSRFWQSLNTRYNVYYNGAQAYIEGSKEKERGNKDNYTERIPLYTVSNKQSRELGKGNFETAITKAEKAIQLHSIKTKPEWNKGRRKTAADIEWLSRKEYNPFLWRAWMLMGRSQFFEGGFDEAAATFSYMSRLYKGQPAIYGKARAWLAKCYVESGWIYDAEDVIRNMMRDSIDWRAQKEWDYTLCDYYLHTEDLPKAAQYLRRVIKHEMRRKQKAREYFLLGQIEAAQGRKQEAYQAFRRVSRLNPPYELQFNARIAMTEVLAEGQSRKMIGRLRRMARNENNKDYLDQVYYAMGNIYLAAKDTANAISAYEKGNKKATRSGIEKGVLLLHLGDLYWQLEKYSDAKRCYGEAIGLLDKERPDYKQLSQRSKVLDELVPYTDAIYLQDSLLELSTMPEKERLEAIDRVIKELKKKEKEEKAKQTETEVEKRRQQYGPQDNGRQQSSQQRPQADKEQSGTWYFYNRQAVIQGKQAFQRTWGKRENVDDWQRNNRTVVDNTQGEVDESDLTDEQRDSLAAAREQQAEETLEDSTALDPHNREYYLAQIPFTEEQKAACHEIIKEGLYKSGVIFKDKLDNLRLSEKQFDRLRSDYTDYEPKDEVYYHLFLLHSRKGDHDVAKTFIDSLKQYCAESKYTTLLTDPYFAENARFGKHIEDSIYGATYEAFKNDRFQEVYGNVAVSESRFPLGENRDRFIFLYGMTKLNDGDTEECIKAMEQLVSEFPQSSVGEMAGMIINGVRAGRQLHGAKFDLSNVWDRRGMELGENSDVKDKTFTDEKNTDFLFIMAYNPDSINTVGTDGKPLSGENQLLFQMARWNFTNFMVRSFDIDIEDSYGMHHMIVSGFRNFDEARQYSRLLLQQENIRRAMGNARPIVISEENLALIGSRYSYNDYDTFYVNHFAPLPMRRSEGLYDAVSVKTENSTERTVERDENGEEHAVDYDPVKPILPTEDVAPGGAKPLEPKKEGEEEETDDDEMGGAFDISVADDVTTSQKENDIDIIDANAKDDAMGDGKDGGKYDAKDDDKSYDIAPDKETAEQPSDDGFVVEADDDKSSGGSVKTEDTFDLPMTETKEEVKPETDTQTFDVMPEEETAKPSADDGFVVNEDTTEPIRGGVKAEETFDVPVTETETVTEPKADEQSFDIIPDDKGEKTASQTADEGFDIVDESSENGAEKKNDEETFEFGDDDAPTVKQEEGFELIDDSEEGKKSSRDLEDEYYELEGF